MKMKQKCISKLKMFDLRISQIDNIMSEIRTKFLNLERVYTVLVICYIPFSQHLLTLKYVK
jgi:hypothetical protein